MTVSWGPGTHTSLPTVAHTAFLDISFQDGLETAYGANGTTDEEVMELLLERLGRQNMAPFNCREFSLAITHLEESLLWLKRRTEKRRARGVHGTSVP